MLFNPSLLLPNIRSRLHRDRTAIVKIDVSILICREIQMTLTPTRKQERRQLFCYFFFFSFDAGYERKMEMAYSEARIHNT
jgi:hypothetical protein